MPVVDFILDALAIIENIFSAAIVAILTYMILGGWKFVFRLISFFFDTQLVKLIGTVFTYFDKIITMDMFKQEFIDQLMSNIYMFIGVIMFFRLMMLVLKYLINPDMVNDQKAGIQQLVQRVIIGCAGILFIPMMFEIANDFQVAILKDSIIQQLIIPSDMVDEVEEKVDSGGNYIGTYVLAGFISPNKNAKQSDINDFDLGVRRGDLSNLDINDGGLFNSDGFRFDYFFFISTIALGYVFYYILKYCIDIAGRAFRLLLYRMLTPVAMIEYMINGSQDGVFKQWLQATLSTYFMLFVRILAVWFVMLITVMMGDNGSQYAGSLLTENDYFLRAIIIIALLGFMMDLPKLVGDVFGLDLEQQGGATSVLKQVGSMAKGAATAGLAIGGAAAAGGYSMGKQGLQGLSNAAHEAGGLKNLAKNGLNNVKDGVGKLKDGLKNAKNDPLGTLKNAPSNIAAGAHKLSEATAKMNDSKFGNTMSAVSSGVIGAVMGSNQYTKALYGGAKGVQDEDKAFDKKTKEKEKEAAAERREEENARNLNNISNITNDIHLQQVADSGTLNGMATALGQVAGGGTLDAGHQNATVTIDNIDVKVTGKATATYDGGLETNITGKAVTNYNGDLETTVSGKAIANYEGDLETTVSGKAIANYQGDIETNVSGKAVANFNGDIETNVSGKAVANVSGDVDVNVGGNSYSTVEGNQETLVGGNQTTMIEQNQEVEVSGHSTTLIEKDQEVLVGGNASLEVDGGINAISRNRNNNDIDN